MNLLFVLWVFDKLIYGDEDEKFLAKCIIAAIFMLGIIAIILCLIFYR